MDSPNQTSNDTARWQLLSLRRSELELKQIFAVLSEENIQAVVIKGWAAARTYPIGHFRHSNDIDIAVRHQDYHRTLDIVKVGNLSHLNIDLHSEFRHLDRTPWDELFARSIITEIEGVKVRTLGHEDHLRVLCAHWLNDGGEYSERLWDIYYAVENRTNDFDWDICLNTVPANRRNWVATALVIANKRLGLEISNIPLRDEERVVPKWVEKTIDKEWKSDVRLVPIATSFNDRKAFWDQVRKRLPPNPIQATIEADGIFDAKSRVGMQVSAIWRRLGPYLRKKK